MKRGDVVLVDWLFSDRKGSKLRPAIVVQADFLNVLIADTVLIPLITTSRSTTTEVVIDPSVETNSGLHRVSIASCNNFLTIDQSLIHHTIGSLTAATMQQIDDGLKRALELP